MDGEPPFKNYSREGVSRREFLTFCAMVAATLAVPSSMVPRIAEALEKREKPILVWLEFQDCAGDTESTLRATKPTLAQLVLDIFSLEYHETLMAAVGHQADKSLADVVKNQKGKYITVVEGAIPLKDGGIYCTVGGRAAVDIAREVCGNAFATIAVGNCATFGGIAAAHPNPTGAVGFNGGYIRLVHHLIMWLTFVFIGTHFYMGWYDDIREKTGVKSSIFSGYKNVDEG